MALLLPVTEVWGGCEIRSGRPPIEHVRDVLFTPYRFDEPWGVFDRGGAAVASAQATVGHARFLYEATLADPKGVARALLAML